MGGMFGGKSLASTPPEIGALKVQQSVYGAAISLVYGQTRIPGNLIWYGDFVATAHEQSQGGKGGGSIKSTEYTYNAAVALGLCEGPITGIPSVWQGKARLVDTDVVTETVTVNHETHYVSFPSFQVTVDHAATWINDLGAFYYEEGTYYPLEKVTGTPEMLQYSVSNGVYTFNPTQTAPVYISYDYTQSTTGAALAKAGLSLFTGTNPQSPWGYLTTAHPGQDIGYQGLAYVAGAGVELDAGGVLPAYNFEVKALLQYGSGIVDANPKAVAYDLLTNSFYGAGFPAEQLDDWTQWSNYCVANGIFISPAYTSQRAMAEILSEIADITNTAIVFSDGKLKMRPYGDQTVTGHGVTYTPVSTVWYDLNDDDYLANGSDPVICTRGNPADAYNAVSVEILNRANQYNVETVEASDASNISQFGRRPQEIIQIHAVCDVTIARGVAQRKLQRGLYIRNEYQFPLGWKYFLLEPMDIITLTDSYLGLDHAPVRITLIEESETGELSFTAEEFPGEVSHNAVYPSQSTDSYSVNFAVSPGNANRPVMFGGPLPLSADTPEIWVATSGGDINYGGCEIWVSNDDTSYIKKATTRGSNRMGVTTTALPAVADPDTSSALGVDLTMSKGRLESATQAQADNGYSTLCYIDGELIAYRDATLTGTNKYTLQYLRRGMYGTKIKEHAVGTPFVRVDGLARVTTSYQDINAILYVKLRAFNRFGQGLQNLADVIANMYQVGAPNAPGMTNITGLELVGQGLNTVFTGRDAKFSWRPSSSTNSYNVGSEPYGGNSGSSGPYFRDYEVRVYDTSTPPVLLRTEHTTDTFWTYTYEKNFEDTAGNPNRSFTVKVYQRGQQGQLSAVPASITVSNPAPAAPSGISVVSLPGGWAVSANVPNLTDLAGMEIWMSTSSGFTPGDGNKVYDGTSNTVSSKATPNTTLYFRLAFYDTFGKAPGQLNVSGEYSCTPIKVGIQDVTTLPASGMLRGDVVYLNGDKKLYRYDGSTWVTWTDGTDILTSSVTAGKINVIDLSAISANMGHITAGDITLDSSGFIKGGQVGYNAGSGFFLGYSGGAYKFSLGVSGGSGITFDGTTTTFTGDVVTSGKMVCTGTYNTGLGYNAAIFGNAGSGNVGVLGNASSGIGVLGFTSTGVAAVYGSTTGVDGIGVQGMASGTSSGVAVGNGIHGESANGNGVYGRTTDATGARAGVYGKSAAGGIGVYSDGLFKSTGSVLITGALTGSRGTGLELGLTTQSTVGAAGSASALPAAPNGYLAIYISGTKLVIPCYNA